MVKSVATLAADMMRAIYRAAGRHPRKDLFVVKVNPEVARYLYDVGAKDLGAMEERLGTKIVLRSTESIEARGVRTGPGHRRRLESFAD